MYAADGCSFVATVTYKHSGWGWQGQPPITLHGSSSLSWLVKQARTVALTLGKINSKDSDLSVGQ